MKITWIPFLVFLFAGTASAQDAIVVNTLDWQRYYPLEIGNTWEYGGLGSNELQWKPLVEEGVKTDGLYVEVLRFGEAQQRPPTVLLKFEAGASYPNHSHPAGEEVYVLEGWGALLDPRTRDITAIAPGICK